MPDLIANPHRRNGGIAGSGAVSQALARPDENGLQFGAQQGTGHVEIHPTPVVMLRSAQLDRNRQHDLLGHCYRQVIAREFATVGGRGIAPRITELEVEIGDASFLLGMEAAPLSPQEYAAYLRDDLAKWRKVVAAAKLTAQ